MKNTKNIFMAMSLSAMLTFSGLMSGSVCAGGAKEYAAQAQLEALHARVKSAEQRRLQTLEADEVDTEETVKLYFRKVNEHLKIYEEGIETESVIVRPTVAEDMPKLGACLKKECSFCNFGAYTDAERKAGLTDDKITQILQKDYVEHMKGRERITFKFTVILKGTQQAIGQYVMSYWPGNGTQSEQFFYDEEHAGEFFKGIEKIQCVK